MKYRYQVKEGQIQTEAGRILVYGVQCLDSAGKELVAVENVFCDSKAAQSFVMRCNEGCLEPIHLWEVMEDTIG